MLGERELSIKRQFFDDIERYASNRGITEQREKLLEIADKCPLHRSLQGDLRIVMALPAAARS